MSHNLSHWLHEYQSDIKSRWWNLAREEGAVSSRALEELAQGDGDGLGAFRSKILLSLDGQDPLDANWFDVLSQRFQQGDISALLGALRRTLFDFSVEQVQRQPSTTVSAPERVTALSSDAGGAGEVTAEQWREIDQGVDALNRAVAEAFDRRLQKIDRKRDRWQTLYDLGRELSASIDIDYVLQKALTRLLDVLEAQRGIVLLLDHETGQLSPRAVQDCPEIELNTQNLPSEWQRGHGDPLILGAGEDTKNTLEGLDCVEDETVFVAPLIANGQFHGLVIIGLASPDGFEPDQLDLAEAAVSNIAANIGSAQVIETLNDQARELGVMLRQNQEESTKREAILESIADGVVVNDQRGRIILVNRAAELILDVHVGELMGRDLQNLLELFTAGAREDIMKAMTAILANPTIELSLEAAQTVLEIDNRVVSARVAPVMTESSEFLGVVTVFRDITEEVKADRAKSEFVSTVSHELRTPMTAIKGYTDLIYSGAVGTINDNQKRFLGIIKGNTDRLTALINDLLDISRIETGRVRFEPKSVQLGDIVSDVIEALVPNADAKEHVLNYRIEAGLPDIKGDPNRLTQVFTNLIGNAIKYTPVGGVIDVEVYRVDQAIRADVRDNGIGMNPDELNQVFDRFYRADHPLVQENRGTGLGLSIVKMFIEMHGGRVWAESEVSQGSMFTVLLPLPTAQKKDEDLEEIWTRAAARLGKRLILVADDDRDIAELIQFNMEQAGYEVTTVGRGVQVLELARRNHPDLIILDILLPDMDGRAVLEALKSDPETADIPVLILSVVADDSSVYDLGASGYLTKPVDEVALLEAVRDAFERHGRILVVEDDPDTIEMMRVALRRVGYTVDVASDGYEALSLARRWQPEVILLDLRLPGMDGYESLSHFKRNPDTQDIPIVVVSAHVADQTREEKRLKALGVRRFVPKPFTIRELVEAIDGVTGRRDSKDFDEIKES
jgi:PAS domain S-box-containing protein